MVKNDTEEQDPIINDDVKEAAPVAAVTPYNEVEEIKVVKDTPMTPDKVVGHVPEVALSHLSLTGEGGVDQSKIPQNNVDFTKEEAEKVVVEAAPQKTWRQLADETIEERRKGQQAKDEAADKRMKWRKALSTISDVTGGIANLIAVGKGAKNIERNDALDAYNKEYKEMIAARNARREEDNLTRAEGVAKDFKEAKDLQALAASRAYDQEMSLKKHEQAQELEELKQQYKLDGYGEQAAARMALEKYKQEQQNKRHEADIKAQNARFYTGEKNERDIAVMKERGLNARKKTEKKVVNNRAKVIEGDEVDESYLEDYDEENKSGKGGKSSSGSKSGVTGGDDDWD